MYILIGLWLSFFVLHSVLAAIPIKNYLIDTFGISPRLYRLQYVILSTVHLMAIFFYTASIPSRFLIQPNPWTNFFGLSFGALGVIIAVKAFRSYDGKAFFGLSDLSKEDEFRTEGLLKHVRHPLYAGSIILLIGFWAYIPNIGNAISVLLMIAYFRIGIYFEEKKLIRLFGEEYLVYRKETPMLLPRFFK
jgi:protein-S-isoprenylcysteine O-methyltransferase Ste14